MRSWLINLAGEGEEAQPIFLMTNLKNEPKQVLLDLLMEFKYVFKWTYAQMPGLHPQLVMHKLNVKEGARPIK